MSQHSTRRGFLLRGALGGHAGLIRDFLTCVETGRTPETICSDNIHSLEMVFGAIQSAETGGIISF